MVAPGESRRHVAVTASAILCYVHVVGAVPIAVVAAYVMVTRTHPITLGFPALSGPIENFFGMDAAIGYAFLYVAVSALGFPAGRWLWRSLKKGAKLAAVIVPFTIGMGVAYGAPGFLLEGPLLAILLAIGWKTLR